MSILRFSLYEVPTALRLVAKVAIELVLSFTGLLATHTSVTADLEPV